MARLIHVTDLTGTVTRQDLFNSWSDATLTDFTEDDLGTSIQRIRAGSTFSDVPAEPTPGALFYHQTNQVMYVWTDELEDTGVSLWLAIGPDVFETACLAVGPIPAGAVVEPTFDRYVQVANPSEPAHDAGSAFIGINQSGLPDPSEPYPGTTAASGAWIRVAIDGVPFAWFPQEDSGVSVAHFGAGGASRDPNLHVGVLAGGRFTGGLGTPNIGGTKCDSQVGYTIHTVTNPSGSTETYARVKWGGGLITNP